MTLNQYLRDLRRKLRDSQSEFWDNEELTTYINDSRKKVNADTGALRQELLGYILPKDTERYPFLDDGQVRVFDVLDIYIYEGASRYPVGYRPYSELRGWWGQNPSWRGRPVLWAAHSRNIVLYPIPERDYKMDLDVIREPYPLTLNVPELDDDIDYPFTDLVVPWAAYLAYLDDKAYREAQEMERWYMKRLYEVLATHYVRRRSWGLIRGR